MLWSLMLKEVNSKLLDSVESLFTWALRKLAVSGILMETLKVHMLTVEKVCLKHIRKLSMEPN